MTLYREAVPDALVAHIEHLRLEEAPPCCPTCGSRIAVTQTRACHDCGLTKPISAFGRNRTRPLGRAYVCRTCKKVRDDARYRRRKAAAFRAILGGVAS